MDPRCHPSLTCALRACALSNLVTVLDICEPATSRLFLHKALHESHEVNLHTTAVAEHQVALEVVLHVDDVFFALLMPYKASACCHWYPFVRLVRLGGSRGPKSPHASPH